MKFLHVCMDLDPSQGGLHRFIVDFAAVTEGHVVSLCTKGRRAERGAGGDRVVQEIAGSRFDGLPCRTGLTRATMGRLAAVIAEADAVFLHSLYRGHLPVAAQICQRRGIPYAVVTHGMLDPVAVARFRLLKESWLRRAGRAVLANAARVVFTTQAELEKSVFHPRREQAAVLLPGIRGAEDPPAAVGATVRAEFGIPAAGRMLVYLNRFAAIKRPLETIRAFAAARLRDAVLVVAGFDAEFTAAALQREVSRHPYARIVVLGPVHGDAKWRLLATADGYVSFSAKENFGYAFAEAMAAGLPCIITAGHDLLGERHQNTADGQAGWVVNPDDQAGLAAAIAAWGNASSQTLDGIGDGNRAWARRALGEAAFAERARALLDGLKRSTVRVAAWE